MNVVSGLDPVVEAFRRNGRTNAALLAALTTEDLFLSDGIGGPIISELLAHTAGFRVRWLNRISPKHAEGLYDAREGLPGLNSFLHAFKTCDEAALKAVQDALQNGCIFDDLYEEGAYQSSPAHFLLNTIVHDSHHRGQIFTLLRQHRRTEEQMDELEEAIWPMWRE